MPSNKIPEAQLGRGIVMLRCAGVPAVQQGKLVHVPLLDNAALYRLLGPSTYRPAQLQRAVVVAAPLDLPTPPTMPTSEMHPLLALASTLQDRLQELPLEDLLSLVERMPEVDPTDSRYGNGTVDEREVAEQEVRSERREKHPEREVPMPAPVEKEKGPRAEEIDLVAAIALWNSGYNSDRKLAKVFHMTIYQANRLAHMIEKQTEKPSTEKGD